MEEKRKNWTATKNGTKPTEWQVAVFRYVKQYTCFRKKWVFDSSREKSVKQRNDVEIKEQFTHYLLLLYICMCAMTRGRRRKDSLCHTYRTILRATWIILYIYIVFGECFRVADLSVYHTLPLCQWMCAFSLQFFILLLLFLCDFRCVRFALYRIFASISLRLWAQFARYWPYTVHYASIYTATEQRSCLHSDA